MIVQPYILRERTEIPEGFEIAEERSGKIAYETFGYPLDDVYPMFFGAHMSPYQELFGIAKDKKEMTKRLHDHLEEWAKYNLKGMVVKDKTGLAAKVTP